MPADVFWLYLFNYSSCTIPSELLIPTWIKLKPPWKANQHVVTFDSAIPAFLTIVPPQSPSLSSSPYICVGSFPSNSILQSCQLPTCCRPPFDPSACQLSLPLLWPLLIFYLLNWYVVSTIRWSDDVHFTGLHYVGDNLYFMLLNYPQGPQLLKWFSLYGTHVKVDDA